jgi:hypothetical protein
MLKWDGDLGRKSESGASKRRRKSELRRKNIELSDSLLKFLKINDDESVRNKDFYQNESTELMETKSDPCDAEILRQCTAAAEATCFREPTSVKDHDASEVAGGSQHKVLENISELCHCEPEILSIISDPVERIIPWTE